MFSNTFQYMSFVKGNLTSEMIIQRDVSQLFLSGMFDLKATHVEHRHILGQFEQVKKCKPKQLDDF